jgi:hypothetical protein
LRAARNSRAVLVKPGIRGQATSRIWIGDLGVTHRAPCVLARNIHPNTLINHHMRSKNAVVEPVAKWAPPCCGEQAAAHNNVETYPGQRAWRAIRGVLSTPSGARTSQTTKTSESSGFFVVGATQNSQGPLIGRTSSTTMRPLIRSKETEQPQRRSNSPGSRRTDLCRRRCDHEWRTSAKIKHQGSTKSAMELRTSLPSPDQLPR